MSKIKYALVLAGGGAKGAYQIGVWKALKELNIKINAVIGNSVGALNGAFIAQNSLEKAQELWDNITLDKIVSIPKELIKNGIFHINSKNISMIKDLQEIFFKNKGLDTAPLRSIIETYIDEKKIRKSKIDFGLIAYNLNNFKPLEIFLEDIPKGLFTDYLVASASIPFIFKKTQIKNKQLIDGGVYDNIPFSMAKRRGYKNIIIVDMSGFGINKRPDIKGTNSIYIKNSIDMGNLLDFSPAFIKNFINIGYLDTLKIFGKIDGIKYFYKKNDKILQKLENLIFDKKIYMEYSNCLKNSNFETNKQNIKNEIKNILPDNFKHFSNYIIALSESAALCLNIEINKLYSYKEFLNLIWTKYNNIEKNIASIDNKKFKNFFEMLTQKVKSIDPTKDFKNFFKLSTYQHEKAFEIIFGKDKTKLHIKTIANFFPNLLPAKVFFVLLKYFFNE